MEEKAIKRFIHKVTGKLKKEPKEDTLINEYAFSSEDLDELQKNNIEKIKELQKVTITKKDKVLDENNLEEAITKKDEIIEKENQAKEEIKMEDILKVASKELEESTTSPKHSFINLEKEHQSLIMSKWDSIDINDIDNDIVEGKDLLNHNYTITYADESAKYIHKIRQKYEVLLCYLIGFNNEKKGLYEKTYFSNKKDTEWKYLNYYIKLLEKIRNFKMNS